MWIEISIIIISLILGGIAFSVPITLSKANTVIIRDPLNRSHYINKHLCIEKKDKITGQTRWGSVWWSKKFECEKPPAESIEVGSKGRKFAEAYKVAADQYTWITDKGLKVEKDTKEGKTHFNIISNGKTIDTFQPFTTTQRSELVNQNKKAEEISKGQWTAEKITQLASVGILGMVIIISFLFVGDFYSGLNSAQSQQNAMLEKQVVISKNLAKISQALGVKIDDIDTNIAQTPATQGNNLVDNLIEPLED